MSATPRNLPRRIAAAALGLGVLALIAWSLDLERTAEVMSSTSPGLLAVCTLLYLPSWPLRGLRWKQIAADLGDRVGLAFATGAATAGNMLNLALPAKAGDLLWANAAHVRFGVPYGRAVVGVLAGRVFDLGVLAGIGALALLAVPGGWERFGAVVGASLAAGFAAVAVGYVLFLRMRLGARLLVGPLARLRGLHDALLDPATTLAHARVWLHCLTTGIIWLNEALVAWVIARGLGLEVSFPAILFCIMVANLSKIFPLTPASFGTYEAAGAFALSVAGVAYSDAFAMALVEHVLKNVVNLLLGLAALVGMDIPVLAVDRGALRETWASYTRGAEADQGPDSDSSNR